MNTSNYIAFYCLFTIEHLLSSEMPALSDEDYEELVERLKLADLMYNEYSLEEVIYQLAKIMFRQSLSRGKLLLLVSTNFSSDSIDQQYHNFLFNNIKSKTRSINLNMFKLKEIIFYIFWYLMQFNTYTYKKDTKNGKLI